MYQVTLLGYTVWMARVSHGLSQFGWNDCTCGCTMWNAAEVRWDW